MPLLGEKAAVNHMKPFFLQTAQYNPNVLPPKTICFGTIYHLSELRRHQRPPVDVNKSESVRVSEPERKRIMQV